jgi:NAD(P)-dependent dehydrogenase (short-subunit alcohol dehydrogenase family)
VRKEADAERLRSAGATPVTIDVTDESSVASAAEQVTGEVGDDGLVGLVNNAGVTVPGPIEFIALDELRRQLEINTLGQVAVTQAFLPALRKGTGRIVFVGSIGGRIAPPFIGAYGASKAAIARISESLRQELASSGMHVALVEPGTVATPIWEKGDQDIKRAIEALPPEGRERYEESMLKGNEAVMKMSRRGIKPDRVARVIESALTSKRPRTRYLVGDAWIQWGVSRVLPDRVFERGVARVLGI